MQTEIHNSMTTKKDLSGRIAMTEDLALYTFNFGLNPGLSNMPQSQFSRNGPHQGSQPQNGDLSTSHLHPIMRQGNQPQNEGRSLQFPQVIQQGSQPRNGDLSTSLLYPTMQQGSQPQTESRSLQTRVVMQQGNQPRNEGQHKLDSSQHIPKGISASLSQSEEPESIPIHEIKTYNVALPYIFLNTNYANKPLCFLIDTGASVSIVKLQNFTITPHLSNDKIKLKGLSEDDSHYETLGSFKIDFEYTFPTNSKLYFSYTLNAVSDRVRLNYDGILGNDFLRKLDCDVKYSQNSLLIRGHLIPLNFNRPVYVIPPRSEIIVECPISNSLDELEHMKDALVLDHIYSEGVYLANCIVTVKPNHCINISVLNTTESEIVFKDYYVHLLPYEPEIVSSASLSNVDYQNINNLFNISNDRSQQVLDLIRTEHLNPEETKMLLECCSEYTDIFYLEGEPLTHTTAIEHSINTGNAAPVHVKSYRFPECHKGEVESQIKNMIDQNIIRPSKSPWSAPIWVVPKKVDATGKQKWRLVIDYRKLNDVTVTEVYPIPLITDILDQLGHSKYFSTLDLVSGFHQIKLNSKDASKTGFTVVGNECYLAFKAFTVMST
ncbi:hypothetical protein B5X24_HaOG214314 [Helicoverpa armigera]|nr:hypothetical protein B5X24_HaOG214314 [Helicoverpa armigera]